MGRICLVALLPALAACDGIADAAAPAASSWGVAVSGCAAVTAGPVCELAEARTLRLWLPKEQAAEHWRFLAGGQPIAPEAVEPVRGGTRLTVRVPAGTRRLSLVAAGAAEAAWALALNDGDPDVLRARKLRAEANLEAAAAHLQRVTEGRGDGALPLRAELAGVKGRRALQAGDVEGALRLLGEAVNLARQAGRTSTAVEDAMVVAYLLGSRLRRIADAGRALRGVRSLAAGYAEGAARFGYYSAQHAHDSGDLRGALHHAAEAELASDRLGLASLRAASRQLLALILVRLGRGPEALAWQRRAEADGERGHPCEAARLRLNRAWITLTMTGEGDRGEGAVGPGAAALAERASRCADPFTLRNLALIEARVALAAQDLPEVRRRLALVRAPFSDAPGAAMEAGAIEAELALLEERPAAAARAFQRVALLARATDHASMLRDALVGRGRAAEALRRPREALAWYEEADRLAGEAVASVPFGEGRVGFLGRNDLAARLRVAALVRAGRAAEAATVARLMRRRALEAAARGRRLSAATDAERERYEAALQVYLAIRERLERRAAADWSLSVAHLRLELEDRGDLLRQARGALDAASSALAALAAPSPPAARLRAPDADEVLLLYVPGGGAAWLGFAVSASAMAAVALGPVDLTAPPARLGAQLLQPFAAVLEKARRIRVLAYGAIDAVDFHALPWRGRPLAFHGSVVYSLDLDGESAGRAPERPSGSLLVVDPGEDLRHATAEARLAARALPPPIVTLRGAAATRSEVLASLAGVDRFHFVGHSESGGSDGHEGALWLAGDGKATVMDLQALAAVPRQVVLSSCRSAATGSAAVPVGVGLAQTFVLLGSRSVVAATRTVADALSQRLMAAFHGGGSPEAGGPDLDQERFHAAQRRIAGEQPGGDWASYRVYVP